MWGSELNLWVVLYSRYFCYFEVNVEAAAVICSLWQYFLCSLRWCPFSSISASLSVSLQYRHNYQRLHPHFHITKFIQQSKLLWLGMSEEMFIGRTLLPKTLLANIVLTFLRIANRAETWEHCVDRLQMALSMNFSFIYGYSSCLQIISCINDCIFYKNIIN